VNKGILQDASTGHPISDGDYIYGTAQRDDGSEFEFTSTQLIEIISGVFGVMHEDQILTVMPYEGCPQIIKAHI